MTPRMSDSDVHRLLWSTDLEDVEVTLSSFNLKPNIPARVVFWQPDTRGEVLLSLSPDEMDALCAAWERVKVRA